MNSFKESLVVNVERKKSGEIIINNELKELLIQFMKNDSDDEKKFKKKIMQMTGIGGKETIERLIEKIVEDDKNLKPLYDEYKTRKPENFNGYNFRPEAIAMLRNDYSQSQMSEKIGVNRRTFSTKLKILQDENADNQLGQLLKEHAERKMNRRKTTPVEKIKINVMLDEYEAEYPVGNAKYEKRDPSIVSLELKTKVLDEIDELIKNGTSLKELDEAKVISESTYRKYKEEVRNLTAIYKENGIGEE